jgi:xanthine dehydrogenase YagS FAD-binding subunit
MRPFEYASPRTEQEAVELLNDHEANTAVLAGGTDLLNLMKQDLLAPQRVVDIKNIDSLKTVSAEGEGVMVGSLVTLEDIKDNPLLADYRSLIDVVDGVKSIQIQSMGTLGGDLCHLPNCWYFRNGYGLLGMQYGESIVAAGSDDRLRQSRRPRLVCRGEAARRVVSRPRRRRYRSRPARHCRRGARG